MKGSYTIGADTHCSFTELAVVAPSGRVTRREQCSTTIRELSRFLETVPKPHVTVIEEGPLADWLLRGLWDRGEKVVVCNPRRNHLIAKDSDKDDAIDAEKLAQLFRGGYTKPVHHSDSEDRMTFKRALASYHDRVRNRVRQANRLMAECRQCGLFIQERHFANAEDWSECRSRIHVPKLALAGLDVMWEGYEAAANQVRKLRQMVIAVAREEMMINRFRALPGVGWIRASTFFAYVDTPFRFKKKQALWRYMGIGLGRRGSGDGPRKMGVSRDANLILKDTIVGAAMSALRTKNNPFADQYWRWQHDGLTPRIARRNVARSLATVMWGMWKSGEVYRPDWVGRSLDATAVTAAKVV